MIFDVDYIVKIDEGVVVCIISECAYNAIALLNKYTGICDNPFCIPPEEFLLSNQYKGVAKCDANDTFDEEYGKKLAYRKAYLKYATAFDKKTKYIIAHYTKLIDKLTEDFDKILVKVYGKTVTATELYNKTLEEANK